MHVNWRTHGFATFLGVVCLALSGEVVVLARQKRALERTLAERPVDPRSETLFQVGEPLFPFDLVRADGQTLPLRFDAGGPRTLLYVLAEGCPVCPEILPRWQEVAPHFLAEGTRVLGVTLGAAGALDAQWIPDVPLVSIPDLTRVPLSKLRTLPITLLADAEGTLEWVHYGTLTDARMAELVSHLR